jgi:hypothetical protein
MNVFNVPNPSSRTVTMGFTQPLTEMRIKSEKIVSGE